MGRGLILTTRPIANFNSEEFIKAHPRVLQVKWGVSSPIYFFKKLRTKSRNSKHFYKHFVQLIYVCTHDHVTREYEVSITDYL